MWEAEAEKGHGRYVGPGASRKPPLCHRLVLVRRELAGIVARLVGRNNGTHYQQASVRRLAFSNAIAASFPLLPLRLWSITFCSAFSNEAKSTLA